MLNMHNFGYRAPGWDECRGYTGVTTPQNILHTSYPNTLERRIPRGPSKRFQPFKKKHIFDQKLHTGTLEGWNDLRNDPEGSGIDFIFLGGWSLVDPK